MLSKGLPGQIMIWRRYSQIWPGALGNINTFCEAHLERSRRRGERLPFCYPPAIASVATLWKKACLEREQHQRCYRQWGEALSLIVPPEGDQQGARPRRRRLLRSKGKSK